MRAYINQNGVQGDRRTIRKYYKSTTFTDSGTFVVPQGTKIIEVDCVAAQGSYVYNGHGRGGRVKCRLKVTSGQTLYITVGKQRTSAGADIYNASDIRTISGDLSSRLVVAGGGGDYGLQGNLYGGSGGGLTGETAFNNSTGGSQSAGGSPGGSFGYGGLAQGRRGGDGWYGGGGGTVYFASGYYFSAGAGGGSSYTSPALCIGVQHTQGYKDGNGYISLSYEVAEGESYDYYVDEGYTALVRNK